MLYEQLTVAKNRGVLITIGSIYHETLFFSFHVCGIIMGVTYEPYGTSTSFDVHDDNLIVYNGKNFCSGKRNAEDTKEFLDAILDLIT